MRYEDTYALDTPEGLRLELQLAGLGSRFVAALLDWMIQVALLLAVALVGGLLQESLGGFVAAFAAVGAFAVLVGYDVAFETLAGGRTPGKRWTGLRVVRLSGAPVTFLPSAVRNLLRLIDLLPGFYVVGMITLLANRRNQRLGDIAAGTLVIRERAGGGGQQVMSPAPVALLEGTERWDVSGVTADEVATVRTFLARRATLAPDVRRRLAAELDGRLRPRVVGPAAEVASEVFLEQLAAVKAARS